MNKNYIGYTIDGLYEIQTLIGKGGTSEVYIAKDTILGQIWAVKCVYNIKDESSLEAKLIHSYKKEIELLKTLNHPAIPRIVYYKEIDECFFVVMDYISGYTLEKKLQVYGALNEDETVQLGIEMAEVLKYLHTCRKHPIIYGDMTPKNIMIEHEHARLLDFGIAQEIPHGEKTNTPGIGTKGFAAPEQYAGKSNLLDERTDIYSLGATLYNAVTCKTLNLQNDNAFSGLSAGITYIIKKCTKKDPKDRYQTTEELLHDLYNVSHFNSDYQKEIKRKLIIFCCSVIITLFSISGIFFSYNSICKKINTQYMENYNIAQGYERKADISQAIDYYIKAINSDPKQLEPYKALWNSYMKQGDLTYVEQKKVALDTFRTNFNLSEVKDGSEFVMMIAKEAITINDPIYTEYAKGLLSELKHSFAYRFNEINKTQVDTLLMLTEYSLKVEPDFKTFEKYLDTLIDNTNNLTSLEPSEKLDNYYMILSFYNAYPNELNQEKAKEVTKTAITLIDENITKDNFKSDKIIPLYQMLALKYYHEGLEITDHDLRNQTFNQSKKYFEKLEDMAVNLDGMTLMAKGDLFAAITDYQTAQSAYLSAIQSFNHDPYASQQEKDNNSLNAYISLTQNAVNIQVKAGSSDFSQAAEYYKKVNEMALKVDNNNLLSSKLKGLRTQMDMVGIGY